MKKLISIELKSNFGFFRKPDTNSGINFSYNILHKPAFLGILGAIIGLKGYEELGKIPEYYQKLEDIKIGIEPLEHEKGSFQKTTIKYTNTIGYANKKMTYLTEESTLIAPFYRCYLLLDFDNEHHQKVAVFLQTGQAEYLPYFGKNEFYAWWDNYKEYEYEENHISQESFLVKTLFNKKEEVIKNNKEDIDVTFDLFNLDKNLDCFFYFERLPLGFDNDLRQYRLGNFVFSTFKLTKNSSIKNLYFLKSENYYVQLL